MKLSSRVSQGEVRASIIFARRVQGLSVLVEAKTKCGDMDRVFPVPLPLDHFVLVSICTISSRQGAIAVGCCSLFQYVIIWEHFGALLRFETD